MKRTIYLLAFLWAFLGQLNAQFNMDIDFGGIERTSQINSLIELEFGQFLQLSSHGKWNEKKKVLFRLFDEQLNWSRSVETDLFYEPSKGSVDQKEFRGIEVWGGKVYVFYMIYNSGNTFKLYAEELDQEMLKLSGEPISLAQFETKADKNKNESYGIVKSHEENLMVFYVKEKVKVEPKLVTEHIQMVVLDESLRKLWQKSYFTPEAGNRSVYLDLTVNKIGEVFLLEQYAEGKLELLESLSGERAHTIHKFDKRGRKRLSEAIDLEHRRARHLSLRMTLNEELLVSGVFFTAEEGNGIAYMRFNTSTLEPQVVTFNLFDLEYIKEGMPKDHVKTLMRKFNRGKPAYLPITIRDFVFKPDGGLIILGEKFIAQEIQKSGSSPSLEYSFDYVYILYLDAEGEVKWKKKIVKRQNHTQSQKGQTPLLGDYAHASFTWANQGDNIILFFNDHVSNIGFDKNLYGVYSTPSNLEACFNAVRIDDEGNMEKEILFYSKDNKVVIHPLRTRFLNKERTELLLVGIYLRKQRLAYLRLE